MDPPEPASCTITEGCRFPECAEILDAMKGDRETARRVSSQGLHDACDTSFMKDQTLPIATFMGYCELGVSEKLKPNRDSRCDQFAEEVQGLMHSGKDLMEANLHMCDDSELGQAIRHKRGQQDPWEKGWHSLKVYDFDRACKTNFLNDLRGRRSPLNEARGNDRYE